MGGYGSGRPREHDLLAERCLGLPVHEIIRGRTRGNGTITWSMNGETTGSIGVETDGSGERGWVRLHYVWKQTEKVDYRVSLTHTRPFFGGIRWWFTCPNIDCGRRVGKLYLAPGQKYFVCRHCLGLCYQSQRERDFDRMIAKARDIRQRLGGDGSLFHPFPAKPKGMHWKTYLRLARQAMEAERVGLERALDALGPDVLP